MKRIAMIPARMGSKRVPKKNLRMILGKPLVAYIIEAAVKAEVFDEIYLNSESEIFNEVAEEYGVSFYNRPSELSEDSTINDQWLEDFILKHPAKTVFQLLPTSPLITPEEIRSFVFGMEEGDYLTYVSVVRHQIASLYQEKPLNFSRTEPHISSQNMRPVFSYATVLMGYNSKQFLKNMKEIGAGYHGGDDRVGYFEVDGLTTIDVDYESDFKLAEVALRARLERQIESPPQYYKEKSEYREEVNVPSIMKKDGVCIGNFDNENLPVTDIDSLISNSDSTKSWSYRVINTESNSATLISQLPGEGNRLHYHPNWNEWWYILKGKWRFIFGGEDKIILPGQIVFIPKNTWHQIKAIGEEPAVRLAVSRADVAHIYHNSKDQVTQKKPAISL